MDDRRNGQSWPVDQSSGWRAPSHELTLLAEDAGLAICLADTQGFARYASPCWLDIMGVSRARAAPGLRISDMWPGRISEERLAVVREVSAANSVVRVLGFCRGRLSLVTSRRTPEDPQLVLCAMRHIHSREQYERLVRDGNVRRALTNWGAELARLKPRELQVLRMLGLGYSAAEMAKALHRSIKTIESHRVSLGRKLPVKNRSELVRTAVDSGIVHLENDELEEWWSRNMIPGDTESFAESRDHQEIAG